MSNEINAKDPIAERDALASDVHSARLFLREKDGLLREFHAVRKDRDALASKLAELEGQEPEPVFWYRPCCDGEMYEGPIHNTQIERVRRLSGAWVPLYARPVPADPVNARLLAIATGQLQHIYSEHCPDPVSRPDSRDPECPACRAIATAESQQAGPVRLTEAEIGVIDRQSREGIKSLMSTWPVPLARAIESAVLRKNGIEVAE